jgi:hypothetical protein
LTRLDIKLRELDEVIKAKEQAASDAEVAIKKLDHEVQALAKDKGWSRHCGNEPREAIRVDRGGKPEGETASRRGSIC